MNTFALAREETKTTTKTTLRARAVAPLLKSVVGFLQPHRPPTTTHMLVFSNRSRLGGYAGTQVGTRGTTPRDGAPGRRARRGAPRRRPGRHLVATSAIREGEVVLTAEAFCAVLDDRAIPTRCEHTFALGSASGGSAALLRCSKSRVARYASRAAQAEAWRAGYREECAALVACAPRVPPPTIRPRARRLWRRARERRGDDRDPYADAADLGLGLGYAAVEALQHHWDAYSDARKARFAEMAILVRAFARAAVGLPVDDPNNQDDPNAPSGVLLRRLTHRPPFQPRRRAPARAHRVQRAHGVRRGAPPDRHRRLPARGDDQPLVRAQLRANLRGETARAPRASRRRRGGGAPSRTSTRATRRTRRAQLARQYHFDIDAGTTDAGTSYTHTTSPEESALVGGAPKAEGDENAPRVFFSRVDFGPDAATPPWRTDPADEDALCAVVVRGARVPGGVAIERVDDDEEEEEEEANPEASFATDDGDDDETEGEDEATKKKAAPSYRAFVWGALPGVRDRAGLCTAAVAGLARADRAAAKLEAGDVAGASREMFADASEDASSSSSPDDDAFGLLDGLAAAHLGASHSTRLDVYATALRVAISSGAFERAGSIAARLTGPYEAAHPRNHPSVGLHRATAAKVRACARATRRGWRSRLGRRGRRARRSPCRTEPTRRSCGRWASSSGGAGGGEDDARGWERRRRGDGDGIEHFYRGAFRDAHHRQHTGAARAEILLNKFERVVVRAGRHFAVKRDRDGWS